MSFITVWRLSKHAFTLAETGLIAQMKLSCLIVFGEGRSIRILSFQCLSNQKIGVTLNVAALLSERERRGWERERERVAEMQGFSRVVSGTPVVVPHYRWVTNTLTRLLRMTLKKENNEINCFCFALCQVRVQLGHSHTVTKNTNLWSRLIAACPSHVLMCFVE